MSNFRDLKVWQDAKTIAVNLYCFIQQSPSLKCNLGLKDQMQRAAISIASNIAEGDARKSDKDSCRFFYIALGSAAELITQLEIVSTLELGDADEIAKLINRIESISKSLGALIKYRKDTL